MSKVSIEGNASGTGTLTIAAPNTNSNYTLTLPTESGTIITGSGGVTGVAQGGTGASTLTANNVILGNGTSAVGFVAPGSSGNILTSNGTTWTSATPAGGGVTSLNGQTGAITNTDVDSIGSYAFAVYQRTNPNSTGRFTYIAIGSTLAGSSLRYGSGADATNVATASLVADAMVPGGAFTNASTAFPSGVGTLSALSGTWRKMAIRIDSSTTSGCVPQYRWNIGVWVRIS